MNKKEFILYALSNPSLPGLIKIGITKDLPKRLSQLFNTSLPTEFNVVDTISFTSIDQARKSEKFLHDYLWLLRDNDNREFFTMTPQAARLLFDKYRNNTLTTIPAPTTDYLNAQEDIKAIQKQLQELNGTITKKDSQLKLINDAITKKDSQLQLINKAIELSAKKYSNTIRHTEEMSTTLVSLSDLQATWHDILHKQEIDIKQNRISKRNLDSAINLRQQEASQLKKTLDTLTERTTTVSKLSLIDSNSSLQENINNLNYILEAYSLFNPIRYFKVKRALKKTLK